METRFIGVPFVSLAVLKPGYEEPADSVCQQGFLKCAHPSDYFRSFSCCAVPGGL
jgi:hypothetical protein